jgi:hypothetical protein
VTTIALLSLAGIVAFAVGICIALAAASRAADEYEQELRDALEDPEG